MGIDTGSSFYYIYLMIGRRFSNDVKELIRVSREIALETGYEYISIQHFFLADCRINKHSSIKNFSFDNDADFKSYLEACRLGPSINNVENLRLTKDVELALKRAPIESYLFSEKKVYPCHIFIAAAKVSKPFKAIFNDRPDLYNRLIGYYHSVGELRSTPTIFRKLFASGLFKRLK